MPDSHSVFYGARRPALQWKNPGVARLRVQRKRVWPPLFVMVLFMGVWYFLLFNQVDFAAAESPWRALWLTLKEEPGLAIPLLLPLLPLVMITRETFGGNYIDFNLEKRIITQLGRRKLGFDDVEALVIQVETERGRRDSAQLSMRRRGGQTFFLCRCVSYTDCSALAQEIASLVGAPVKSESDGKG